MLGDRLRGPLPYADTPALTFTPLLSPPRPGHHLCALPPPPLPRHTGRLGCWGWGGGGPGRGEVWAGPGGRGEPGVGADPRGAGQAPRGQLSAPQRPRRPAGESGGATVGVGSGQGAGRAGRWLQPRLGAPPTGSAPSSAQRPRPGFPWGAAPTPVGGSPGLRRHPLILFVFCKGALKSLLHRHSAQFKVLRRHLSGTHGCSYRSE